MSEQSEGEGWWLAVDGRWYAPHLHPDAQAAEAHETAGDSGTAGGPDDADDDAGDEASAGATADTSAVADTGHDFSRAGSSAAAEAERLAAEREKLEKKQRNYEKGAEGERITGQRLSTLSAEFVVLHDLHVPGSRANVDHLVIGPNGVFVVDSKAYTGKLTAGDGTLWRGKYPIRDKIETLTFISGRIAEHLEVPVASIMCFTEAELPQQVNQLGAAYAVTLNALVPTLCSGLAIHSADKVKWLARLATELLEPTKRQGSGASAGQSAPAASGRSSSKANTKASGGTAAGSKPSATKSAGGKKKPAAQSPARKRGKKKTSFVEALFGLVLVLLFIVFVVPRVTKIMTRSSTSTPPVASAVSLPATVAFSCPAPGAGYSMTLGWPVGSKSLISYQIVAQSAGAEIFNQSIFSPAATLPPVTGLVPAIQITLITTATSYGKPLPPNEQVVTAPAEPC